MKNFDGERTPGAIAASRRRAEAANAQHEAYVASGGSTCPICKSNFITKNRKTKTCSTECSLKLGVQNQPKRFTTPNKGKLITDRVLSNHWGGI